MDILSGSYDCVDRIVLNATSAWGIVRWVRAVWWAGAVTGRTKPSKMPTAEDGRTFQPFAFAAMPKRTIFAVIDCSVGGAQSTTGPDIAPRTPFVAGLFWSWLSSAGAGRFGCQPPNTNRTKRSRSVRSTLFVIFLDPQWGVISPSQVQRASSLPAQVI